jgi:dipeptidyl-peptidase-4
MKKLIVFIGFAAILNQGHAQKKQLTIEDAMLNARTTLAPENLKQLQFIRGTDNYVYLKKINGVDTWMQGDYSSKEETPYLTLQSFNQKLRAASMDTLVSMPAIQFYKDYLVTTVKGQKVSFSNNNSYKLIIDKATAEKDNVEESKEGFVAYVDNHNLFVSKNGNSKKVTGDGSDDIVYASTVHQSEFGITKGTFWSNDGKLLAFYRMDQSVTPNYPIIDWTERPAKVNNLRYPMAGDTSHHVTLGIYDAMTQKTIWVKTTGPAEQFLTNIAWSPDDQFVYIVIVNREQNHFWVNQYNAASGEFVKTLFEEKDDKYAEPLVPMLFLKNNANKFIWQIKRDGWNHL